MRKLAFTMAEVLITLGILGVVIAMTLPAIISKYQEKVWLTAYFRVYSILENAYKQTQVEHDTFEYWSGSVLTKDGSTLSDRKMLYKYMVEPYMELNQSFIPDDDNWSEYWPKTNCWPEKSSHLDGTPYTSNLNGELLHKPAVSLKSGECIVLSYWLGDFMVDINSKKGPNVLGKDQFAFSFDLVNRTRLKPGYPQRWWTDTPLYCDVSSTNGWHAGASCGFWIVRHRNMDYLHIPYEELKRRWSGGVW